jgi:RND family efflux transporter MFP subunit
MSKKIINVFIGIIILCTIGGCSKKVEETVEEQLTPVEIQTVQKGEIQLEHSVSARIKPLKEVSVLPKVPGKVETAYGDVGDRVSLGQVLFTLEKKDLYNQLNQIEAQLKQSQASIDAAQLNYERAKGSGQEQQVMQVDAALKQTEVALEQAETNYLTVKNEYERNKLLYEANAISKQVMDSIESNYNAAQFALKNAKQAYETALSNYELIKNRITVDSIEAARAQLNQAVAGKEAIEVQKEMIRQQLDDTNVRSPLSGTISQKTVEVGSLVSQQIPAYTVVEMEQVIIEADVTERIINSISVGQDVIVSVNALGDKEFKGNVDAVSPAIAGQSAGYTVKIIVDNSERQLKPGMFARVTFMLEKKENIFTVPIEAVLSHNDETYVFVLEDSVAKRRIIQTGLKNEYDYEVIQGLDENEKIIIRGQRFVADGEKVQTAEGE